MKSHLVQLWPLWTAFVGAGVLLLALLYGAGNAIPFPDPTPELLARRERIADLAWIAGTSGGVLVAFGAIAWCVARR